MAQVAEEPITNRHIKAELEVDQDTLTRWAVSCIYLDDDPFQVTNKHRDHTGAMVLSHDPEQYRRIQERQRQIADGRWQSSKTGVWWISHERTNAILKSGEGSHGDKTHECRLLREEEISWRTLRTLGRLWGQKRSELIPDQSDLPFSCVRYEQKWYAEAGVWAMKAWLEMPHWHYGTFADPRLDLAGAASYVGCNELTITNRIGDKAVGDWSRNGKGEIRTWRLVVLDSLKKERGRDEGNGIIHGADGKKKFTPKAAAVRLGWDRQKVELAVRRAKQPAGSLGRARATLLPTNGERLRQKKGGKPSAVISEDVIEEVERDFTDRARKDGYSTQSELGAELGIKKARQGHELSECLVLWIEQERLKSERAIVETSTKHDRTLTQDLLTVNKKQFLDLWTRTCSVKSGVAHLKLLLPITQPETVKVVSTVEAAMKAEGFVGIRLQDVKRQAGFVCWQPEGQAKEAFVCKRANPQEGLAGPAISVLHPKRNRPDPVPILQAIVPEGGSCWSTEGMRLAKEAGLKQHEVYGCIGTNSKHTGIETAKIGDGDSPLRPSCWYRGRKPASADEVRRPRLVSGAGKRLAPPANGAAKIETTKTKKRPGGRPREQNSDAIDAECYRVYQTARLPKKHALRTVKDTLGDDAPGDWSTIRSRAERYATEHNLPFQKRS